MPRLRFVSTVQGASTIELNEPIVTIGRVANNVVCIEDPNISKHHTLLVSEDDTYKIYDLHSVNGTWVNGERITVTRLKEGDAVRIGYLELKYEIAAPVVAPVVGVPPVVGARPAIVAPAASKTATGPTTLAARPRLGLKAPGTAVAPVVVPVKAASAPIPVVPPAPVKEEPRQPIQVPAEKKSTGATPTPAPVPAASEATPKLGGLSKPFARPAAPAPAEPAPTETPAEPAAPVASEATPKLGGLSKPKLFSAPAAPAPVEPTPAEPVAPVASEAPPKLDEPAQPKPVSPPVAPAPAEPAPTDTPAEPAASEATPKLGGLPKLKTFARPAAGEAAATETPGEPGRPPVKKLGGIPGGGPAKFKLKRE